MSTSLSLGARGFRIDGAVASDDAGFSVAGAGDVNGDGVDDVIVGALGADNNGRISLGVGVCDLRRGDLDGRRSRESWRARFPDRWRRRQRQRWRFGCWGG